MAVHLLANDHVAGQQQTDVRLRRERAVRQWRIAGAQDAVGAAVDAEFGLHRRLDVDLGEDAEALGLEGLGHLGHGLGEVLPGQDTLKAVARSRGNAGGDGHAAHGAGPHWVAGEAGMRCVIMSIIICIMAMCSVII